MLPPEEYLRNARLVDLLACFRHVLIHLRRHRMPPKPMRILALPLARLPASGDAAKVAANPLLLFHLSAPPPASSIDAGSQSLLNKALQKASDAWLNLGKGDQKGMKYKIWKKGESLMDKIEFEEWALKSIQVDTGVKIARKEDGSVDMDKMQGIKIPMLYPSGFAKERSLPLPPLLPTLRAQLQHRVPFHKTMMTRSLLFAPLTFPFAIVPVLPNLPLFYVLWRAWSHYKAWRGALYLETLIKAETIVEGEDRASVDLDAIYNGQGGQNDAPDATVTPEKVTGQLTSHVDVKSVSDAAVPNPENPEIAPDTTATPESMVYQGSEKESLSRASSPTYNPDDLFLRSDQIPFLASTFHLLPSEIVDITRAVEQAELRLGRTGGTEWRGNLHK